MPITPARRAALAALAVFAVGPLAACATTEDPDATSGAEGQDSAVDASHEAELERLEEEFDAVLGVYALDAGSDLEVAFNADERFAYASTYKALACAAVMERRSMPELEEVVTFDAEDLVTYSPVVEEHLDTGMTWLEVCDAAIRYSDNTAGNRLLEDLGGPEGFQEALEEIGDEVTEVVRIEPELNDVAPGETQDTSTPRALAEDLRHYVLGDILEEDKRVLLRQMLVENLTGDDRIRAGVPDDWEVGDKTGTTGTGTHNDIAVLWPPEGEPVVLAVLVDVDAEDDESGDALIAEATTVVLDALS